MSTFVEQFSVFCCLQYASDCEMLVCPHCLTTGIYAWWLFLFLSFHFIFFSLRILPRLHSVHFVQSLAYFPCGAVHYVAGFLVGLLVWFLCCLVTCVIRYSHFLLCSSSSELPFCLSFLSCEHRNRWLKNFIFPFAYLFPTFKCRDFFFPPIFCFCLTEVSFSLAMC